MRLCDWRASAAALRALAAVRAGILLGKEEFSRSEGAEEVLGRSRGWGHFIFAQTWPSALAQALSRATLLMHVIDLHHRPISDADDYFDYPVRRQGLA